LGEPLRRVSSFACGFPLAGGIATTVSAPLGHSSFQITVHASILVSVVVPDPVLRSFQTLLISPLRNQIEVVVGAVHHVDSPRVARVGVNNRGALVFVQHAASLTVRVVGVHPRTVVECRSTVAYA